MRKTNRVCKLDSFQMDTEQKTGVRIAISVIEKIIAIMVLRCLQS